MPSVLFQRYKSQGHQASDPQLELVVRLVAFLVRLGHLSVYGLTEVEMASGYLKVVKMLFKSIDARALEVHHHSLEIDCDAT